MLDKWNSLNDVPNRSHILGNAKDMIGIAIIKSIKDSVVVSLDNVKINIRWRIWMIVWSGLKRPIRDAINVK
jgi:hypothetical protein